MGSWSVKVFQLFCVPLLFLHDCYAVYVFTSSLDPSTDVLFLSVSDVVELLLSQPNVEVNQQVGWG